jgi:phage baseplate assembly protein W
MPIINGIRKINPLDLNKNVKIGVAFPIDEENMFNGTQTVREQIKSNLINLLLTEQGERVNLPEYGIGLKNKLFEQELDPKLIETQISDQIARYMGQEIELTDIQTSTEDHTLFVRIVYKVIWVASTNVGPNGDESYDAIEIGFKD